MKKTRREAANSMLFHMVVAAMAYYEYDINILSDAEYDKLTKAVVKKKPFLFNNRLYKLIDWDSLAESSTLHYVHFTKLPQYFHDYVHKWNLKKNSKS